MDLDLKMIAATGYIFSGEKAREMVKENEAAYDFISMESKIVDGGEKKWRVVGYKKKVVPITTKKEKKK